jgi:fatty-acyl-CoA synthase
MMRDIVYSGPTVSQQSLRALARHPDRDAFVWDTGRLTYAATLDLIGRMQAVFAAQGLGRGQHVALLTANRAEAWCAGVAAQACGLAITWLHPMGSLADQQDQMEDFEADALVVDAAGFGDRGGHLAAGNAAPRVVLTLGPASYGRDLLALAQSVGASRPVDLAQPGDIAILNYTGGTTGKSKGAVRRHGNQPASTTVVLADFDLPRDPSYLAISPISHVAGTKILPSLMRGGTTHLLRGFDPEQVLATIARERINFALLVPTMIYGILDHPGLDGADLSSLELLMYGASPMSPTRLIEGLERIGPVFAQLYGQTECYPISYLSRADHDPARPERFAACGFPVASCDVALLDDDGAPVAPGEAGEICARSPYVMDEYWKRPEQTAETLQGGWLHTGDVARADEEGCLFIVDRKKDMIVSGGFNIYPREVEDALSTHPGVASAAVIGVPDPKWGEAVMAMVVRRPGAEVTAEALMSQVKAMKGGPHTPKRIEFVDALPLTGVGKVDKKALRSSYWANQERMVG